MAAYAFQPNLCLILQTVLPSLLRAAKRVVVYEGLVVHHVGWVVVLIFMGGCIVI